MKIKQVILTLLFLPNKVLIGLVWIYQKTISPLVGPRCKYWPSCSSYTSTALANHNIIKALLLSAWRIARCNPFSQGGLDPVPVKGRWLPDINTDGANKA